MSSCFWSGASRELHGRRSVIHVRLRATAIQLHRLSRRHCFWGNFEVHTSHRHRLQDASGVAPDTKLPKVSNSCPALCYENAWRSGGIAPPFLTSALDGGEWSASRPGHFTAGETAPDTPLIGGWVGPRTGMDAVEISITN
jgi:hypothetical protein